MKSPGTVLGLIALLGVAAIYVRVESLAGHARPRRAPAARARHADTPQAPRLTSAKRDIDLEQRIADLERELEKSPSPDTAPATGLTEFAKLAEQLQLTDPQKTQIEATVTRGKQRVEDLLRIPDEEGVRPVDRRRDHRAKLRAAAERGDLQAVLRLFAEAKRSSALLAHANLSRARASWGPGAMINRIDRTAGDASAGCSTSTTGGPVEFFETIGPRQASEGS